MLPLGQTAQQFLIPQGQLQSQVMVQGQQVIPQLVPQQSKFAPVYIVRTVEQSGQVMQQIQQIPQPVLPMQLTNRVQQVPQMVVVPSVNQMVPQQQGFAFPQMLLQTPTQGITLQVPGTLYFGSNTGLNYDFDF